MGDAHDTSPTTSYIAQRTQNNVARHRTQNIANDKLHRTTHFANDKLHRTTHFASVVAKNTVFGKWLKAPRALGRERKGLGAP